MYLIEEFERLKTEEQKLPGRSAKRERWEINYRIHIDVIKSHLLPAEKTSVQASLVYADEADGLNVAMFGKTGRQWREENPELKKYPWLCLYKRTYLHLQHGESQCRFY